jgi:hypothetical protein
VTFKLHERLRLGGADVDLSFSAKSTSGVESRVPWWVSKGAAKITWSAMVAVFICENGYIGDEADRRC